MTYTPAHQRVIDAYWAGQKVRREDWDLDGYMRLDDRMMPVDERGTTMYPDFSLLMHGVGEWGVVEEKVVEEKVTWEAARKHMDAGGIASTRGFCYILHHGLLTRVGGDDSGSHPSFDVAYLDAQWVLL